MVGRTISMKQPMHRLGEGGGQQHVEGERRSGAAHLLLKRRYVSISISIRVECADIELSARLLGFRRGLRDLLHFDNRSHRGKQRVAPYLRL